MFFFEGEDELSSVHKLYLPGVRTDEEFIAQLRQVNNIDYTAQYRTANMSFIELFMVRPCYAVELTPMIAPLVEQLAVRQNATNAS